MRIFMKENIATIILLGLFIHILLLICVFDTYFQSPLEHGITSVKSTESAKSKRIVLFVADGLRAQAILGENEDRAPFLTSIRKQRGSWGISHTRVPTESRPGHVALLAGIFEDPSAIFKGWKHNPVDFDSVINQSSNAWCIGSPDIVPIFNRDQREHIHVYAYDAKMQDFGNKNTTILDEWVFDKTRWILNTGNFERLKQSGNIFFLHLLGLDTAGHAFKPYSKEYINNIRFVDGNIEKMEKLFSQIFTDNLTSFIFTSDHGMTDWGSHGSGLNHETFTPIIAWGAGVKSDNQQKDIKQIDIAPLLSSLIGINYPNNNLGQVPIDYLDVSESKKLHNFLTNIQQVFKIFNTKEQKIQKSSLFYKPYTHLTTQSFEKKFTELWYSKDSFEITREMCKELFNETIKAIDYCHNYFMNYVLFSVSFGLIFWVIFLATFLFSFGESKNDKLTYILRTSSLFYNILVFFTCIFQSFSIMYYLYFLFPGTIFYFVLPKIRKLTGVFSLRLNVFIYIHLIYFSTCIVLLIYGFHFRYSYCFLMILISFSLFLNPDTSAQIDNTLKLVWILICWILSIFPLLPLMFTKFQIIYFSLGFGLWQILNYCIIYKEMHKSKQRLFISGLQKYMFYLQNTILNLSFLNCLLISLNVIHDSTILKSISWCLFFFSVFLIPLSNKSIEVRIYTIFQAFGPFYLMTTMSYELIFITFYCFFLILWMKLETKLKSRRFRELENFRKCLIFVSMILIGFFGTGNIASLNSFDPMWVRCFLTVFSPFKMTILIFLKLILPFIFTACVFRYIVLKTDMNLVKSFCVILLISDIMVLYFLYHIKNVGSWLDIGMSLSHFVVVECLTLGILVLYYVAYVLTNTKIDVKLFNNKTVEKYV